MDLKPFMRQACYAASQCMRIEHTWLISYDYATLTLVLLSSDTCLVNVPEVSSLTDEQPGLVYTADQQCNMTYGNGAVLCRVRELYSIYVEGIFIYTIITNSSFQMLVTPYSACLQWTAVVSFPSFNRYSHVHVWLD